MDMVTSIGFVAFGAAALLWSLREIVLGAQSVHWPQAIGTIVVSKVREGRDSDGDRQYRGEISYRYTVAGNDFTCGRVRFFGDIGLNWSAPAARIVEKYPVGATVTVRYKPGNPRQGVLEPGVNRLAFIGIAFGTVFVVLGILFS
jgi:hypothetical protein